MTRTRNSAFGGTTPPDVDVDVPAYTSIIREINQDANLLYDKLTGENGIASDQIIAKNGYVADGTVKTGPPLRRPVWNQALLTNSDTGDISSRSAIVPEADYDLYGGRAYLLAVPFFVPVGETDFVLDVALEQVFGSDPEWEVRDTSWALHSAGALSQETPDGFEREVWRGVLQFPTQGQYYLLVIGTLGWEGNYLKSVRCYPDRKRSGSAPNLPTASFNPMPVGNGTGEVYRDIHDEMIADDYPVAGWVVTALNRNVNWLLEYVTGAPVPGNSARQLADAQHMRHRADTFANEGQVQVVLATEALGAITLDRRFVISSSGERGCVGWPPIIPLTYDTTRRTFHKWSGRTFGLDTANNLRCRVLAVWDGKGDTTQWNLRVTHEGSSTSSSNFAMIGTSGFYFAEVTAINEVAGVSTTSFELQRSAVGTGVHGEIAILGYQLYYSP